MDYNGLVELESTAADSAAIGKGTFLLADNRETVESGGYAVTENGVTKNYKTYLVRRLADGNCWMVQNLDLNLKTFAGTNKLTSENTDLSVSRTDLIDLGNGVKAWDPSASLRNNTWHTTADPNTTITGGYANHLGQANILEPGPGYDNIVAPSLRVVVTRFCHCRIPVKKRSTCLNLLSGCVCMGVVVSAIDSVTLSAPIVLYL